MAQPSRTINRLHFDDLNPGRVEDLSLALVCRLHQWEDIQDDRRNPVGRTMSEMIRARRL